MDNGPPRVSRSADPEEEVRIIALQLLARVTEPKTEDVRSAVERAVRAAEYDPTKVNVAAVCLRIEASLNVWVVPGSILDAKNEDHIDWLTDTMAFVSPLRPTTDWSFWKGYKRFLQEARKRPDAVIRAIDRSTSDVLKRLEDPVRPGPWDRRGMVVGNVQSGKTQHYTGLVNKAADAGYKLIFVLAGLHNNLRSQTQFRLDEEFLGWESDKAFAYSEKNSRIGVGALLGEVRPRVHTLTNSSDQGDFSAKVAMQSGVTPGGDPILFVVKKNVSILRNLNTWIRTLTAYNHADNKVHGLPALVIDDECDLASVNTRPLDLDDPDYDVTAINREIRRLLLAFDTKAYIGYTATPFASIFIHPDNPHIEYGADLFPRSFIITVPRPSNYVGPVEVFGLEADGSTSGKGGLPIVEKVTDQASAIPDGHRQDLTVSNLPQSLRDAIRSFVLACAIRRQRGDESAHNSMLIHVSKYVAVHDQITDLVTEELETLQRRIRYLDGTTDPTQAPIIRDFQALWSNDFLPKSRAMHTELPQPKWDEIAKNLEPAASKIRIKTINNSVKDILDYRVHQKDGLSAIVIGGDKLSRGLTLEGLTISYYLRAANMYDTLMQMGRWFGYRDGYDDLCRIYTTGEIVELYRWIAMASEELRQDLVHMERIGATPDDFGLRVRMHPAGLLVTALNKMRAGTPLEFSYANSMQQTLVFSLEQKHIEQNERTTDHFLRALGNPGDPVSKVLVGPVWNSVRGDVIAEYLSTFFIHPDNPQIRNDVLVDFINGQIRQGELTNWTVSLAANGTGREIRLAGFTIKMAVRNAPESGLGDNRVSLNGVTSPTHEAVDLTPKQWDTALQASIDSWELEGEKSEGKKRSSKPDRPYPSEIRSCRNPQNGLLLIYPIDPVASGWLKTSDRPVIGLGISFPPSTSARPTRYLVNKRFRDEFS